jgi:predicted murein hydrolase (TIGR00659 family)
MSPAPLGALWVYLAASPLLGLTITLIAYVVAYAIHRRLGFSPLANPVFIATFILVVVLSATHTSYRTYFEGAQFVHFLLGPATVALAVPLFRQLPTLRTSVLPLAAGLLAGSLTAIVSAVAVASAFGVPRSILASLAPKSATTPIAMGVADKLGGLPSLTAVFVLVTGVFGAVVGRSVLNALGIVQPRVRGFALGVSSHGIGTARAFQVGPEAGAFSGLGMGLNGALTALLVPLVFPWLVHWLGR